MPISLAARLAGKDQRRQILAVELKISAIDCRSGDYRMLFNFVLLHGDINHFFYFAFALFVFAGSHYGDLVVGIWASLLQNKNRMKIKSSLKLE
jgi:hypothetical protein